MPERDSPSLVSIIIPTYNRSNLLRLTVESVLAQTYPNIEIIVIDDGSTDDTEAVMASYAGRVIYVKQEHGATNGRYKGFQMASGEYINFLDHDDLIMPTKIERQVQILDSQPEIGLVHCGYYYMDKDGDFLEAVSFLPAGTLEELVCGDFIWSGAPLIRRQCLDRVGRFDRCSDWDMWIRIAQAGFQFACIQQPLGAYRILPDSQMANITQLESAIFWILDRVFADPHLPPEVAAVKERAQGGYRFWISCRYYAAGMWENAQRNLVEALELRPQLLEHPGELLELWRGHALSMRVSDPVGFVMGVLDHLPPVVESLGQYRSQLLSQVYVGLSLREYGSGRIAQAQGYLAKAVALEPSVFDQSDDSAELICHNAMRLPVNDPVRYVETVFQNLPACAQPLAPLQSRVLGEVSMGCAFRDYFAGRPRQVVQRILAALRHHPSWLLNKGVASILLKSLLGSVTAQPTDG
jgi:glycosyltransferase involved in cell wall biosynthesis